MSTSSNRYGSIRKNYRNARADKQRLSGFVRKALANPKFAEWLNSDQIRCDEFLNCARTACQLSQPVSVGETRQASLRWLQLVEQLVDASRGGVQGWLPLVSNIAHMDAPERAEVRRFLLSRTKVPHFSDAAHRLLFLHCFCDAAKDPACKTALVDRILDEPSWITDAEVSSCVAVLQGPTVIGLLLDAASRTKNTRHRNEIIRALEAMTGKPQVQSAKAYLQDVRKWYDGVKDRLVVDTLALYPAPVPSALFIVEEP